MEVTGNITCASHPFPDIADNLQHNEMICQTNTEIGTSAILTHGLAEGPFAAVGTDDPARHFFEAGGGLRLPTDLGPKAIERSRDSLLPSRSASAAD